MTSSKNTPGSRNRLGLLTCWADSLRQEQTPMQYLPKAKTNNHNKRCKMYPCFSLPYILHHLANDLLKSIQWLPMTFQSANSLTVGTAMPREWGSVKACNEEIWPRVVQPREVSLTKHGYSVTYGINCPFLGKSGERVGQAKETEQNTMAGRRGGRDRELKSEDKGCLCYKMRVETPGSVLEVTLGISITLKVTLAGLGDRMTVRKKRRLPDCTADGQWCPL